jgi:hypothetical protein
MLLKFICSSFIWQSLSQEGQSQRSGVVTFIPEVTGHFLLHFGIIKRSRGYK